MQKIISNALLSSKLLKVINWLQPKAAIQNPEPLKELIFRKLCNFAFPTSAKSEKRRKQSQGRILISENTHF